MADSGRLFYFLNSQAFARFSSYDLSVIPLFLLMGQFASQGGLPVELVEASGKTEMKHGDVVVAFEVEDLAAEIDRLKAAGIRAYHQKPTENLPLERGWITKGDAHGTIIELCPKGEVARFVAGKGK